MIRAAAYCRVSTDKDAQLDSLKNQEEFFREYMGRNGLELTEIYADEGISGKQMKNRKAFLRMLDDGRHGCFELVVVKDISRFARNTVDFLNAVRELRGRDIEVRFLSNNQTVLGNSEFILTIFSAMAQEESANLSKRVKFGKKLNAEKGRVPNNIYGYEQADTFTLAVNSREAPVVRRIFTLYLEGAGVRKIAQLLNGDGVPTKRGAKWQPRTIRRMLENPLYMGVLVNHKQETKDFLTGERKTFPEEERFRHQRPEYAIVSPDTYCAVQKLLARRGTSSEKSVRKYLFSGLLRCGGCGYSFGRRCYHGKKGDRVVWRCSGRKLADFCASTVTIPEEELLEALGNALKAAIPDREAFAAQVRQAAERLSPAGRVEQRDQELERLEVRLSRQKSMFESGVTTLEELKREAEKIAERRSALLQEQPQAVPQLDCQGFFSLKSWSNADLRELVEKIQVSPDGTADIFFNPL